jgi:hypothetical protein
MNYKMMWRDKRNPSSWGEGRSVSNEDTAFKICKKNNELFPEYEHWYEVQTTKNRKDNGTREQQQ